MGAKVISITNNTKNKLRALSDINIVIPSVEMNESRLEAIFSRYGQLFVVDMLFEMCIRDRITAAFFPEHTALILISVYLIGIFVAILSACLLYTSSYIAQYAV